MLDIQLITELKNRSHISNEMKIRGAENVYSEFIKTYDELKKERKVSDPMITKLARTATLASINKGLGNKDKIVFLIDKYLRLPNLRDKSMPVGEDKIGDKIIYERGLDTRNHRMLRKYDELGEKLGIFIPEVNKKISDDGFPFLFGAGPLLERAIINFMLDTHKEHGYNEISVPTPVNERSMFSTGSFPTHVNNVYHLENTNLYLNPTIEMQETNLIRGVAFKHILNKPLRLVGFARSFRVEKEKTMTSYKTLHEFGKVELFVACKKEDWKKEYERTIREVELILDSLELPYRRVLLCTGSVGVSSHLINDYEVFAPGSNEWWEVTSVTSHSDFPSRRMNSTYINNLGNEDFVHTLHVPALSIPRVLSSILENHQTKSGEVNLPRCLRKYMGGLKKISTDKYVSKYINP